MYIALGISWKDWYFMKRNRITSSKKEAIVISSFALNGLTRDAFSHYMNFDMIEADDVLVATPWPTIRIGDQYRLDEPSRFGRKATMRATTINSVGQFYGDGSQRRRRKTMDRNHESQSIMMHVYALALLISIKRFWNRKGPSVDRPDRPRKL